MKEYTCGQLINMLMDEIVHLTLCGNSKTYLRKKFINRIYKILDSIKEVINNMGK